VVAQALVGDQRPGDDEGDQQRRLGQAEPAQPGPHARHRIRAQL
jgi:hypothetical protein